MTQFNNALFCHWTRSVTFTRAVRSQGEPRDAAAWAVNFGTYRSLQRHRAVSLPQHGFLVQASISHRSNAEITQSTLIFTAS